MKNKEIIARAAILAGEITEEDAKRCLNMGEDIPLHTISGWKLRGDFIVKEGEEPIEVRLWKKREDGGGFYLAKSKLYRRSQLELKS